MRDVGAGVATDVDVRAIEEEASIATVTGTVDIPTTGAETVLADLLNEYEDEAENPAEVTVKVVVFILVVNTVLYTRTTSVIVCNLSTTEVCLAKLVIVFAIGTVIVDAKRLET